MHSTGMLSCQMIILVCVTTYKKGATTYPVHSYQADFQPSSQTSGMAYRGNQDHSAEQALASTLCSQYPLFHTLIVHT